MAESRKADWHAQVLKRTDLTPDVRSYHEEALRAAKSGAQSAPAQPSAPAPKPPRAARRKTPATPTAGGQRAAPDAAERVRERLAAGAAPAPVHRQAPASAPPSAAAAYTAAHAHLHTGAAPSAPSRPKPQPQAQSAHTHEQMTALAEYHEKEQRRFAMQGDARGAAVHGHKAATMRQALQEHAQRGASAPAQPNTAADAHLDEASHHRHLANRAGVKRAAASADVLEAQHAAERVAADPQHGKGSLAHQVALAAVASHRERVAQHANEEKVHFADEKVSIARAKGARATDSKAKARAANEALAAEARADQAKEAIRGGHARIGIAQIHAQRAANPSQEQAAHGRPRDVLRERTERIKHASDAFHQILQTGGDELIKHMQHQVGH